MTKGSLHILLDPSYVPKYFTRRMSANKAKGIFAQVDFANHLDKDLRSLHRQGCWVVSPNVGGSHQYRFAIFTGPRILRGNADSDSEIEQITKDYAFQRICHFLRDAGLATLLALPIAGEESTAIASDEDLESVDWAMFIFTDDGVTPHRDAFSSWPKRGRASIRKRSWDGSTLNRLGSINSDDLHSIFLNEHFYSDFFKKKLKVSTQDPYDIDGFFAAYDGSVLPIEIKEKYPGLGKTKFFGIDAGRVIMLLRLGLPTDSNSLYIVKEVDDTEERELVGWKYITLSDIVSTAGWNLTSGGRGMTGGRTQTIILPYSAFDELDSVTPSTLSEIEAMPAEVRSRARNYLLNLERWLGTTE